MVLKRKPINMVLRILLTFLLTISLAYGACPTFQRVNQGDPAPCNGAFFNTKAEKKLKDSHSKLTKQNEVLKGNLKLSDLQVQNREEKSKIWQKEAQRQAEERMKLMGNLRTGIIIGVSGTILVFFVNSLIIKASK